MLITESLAEPLQENVRPKKPKPEKNKSVTASACGNKHNGTGCVNKNSSKDIKNRRFKTKLLEDAKKFKFIENRNQLLKKKAKQLENLL